MTGTTAGDTLRSATDIFQQTITAFSDLIGQSTKLGVDLLNSLAASSSTLNLPASLNLSSLTKPIQPSCGCKIPPPCWMPVSAGMAVSHVCSGSSACLRVRVTNCGPARRDIRFDDGGANRISFSPQTLSLGPMETGVVTATLPAATASGQSGDQDVLVWIRGCKEHYVRWTVKTVTRGAECCCHEVSVDDCPDYLHHWYDHFYCPRPCPAPAGNNG
jgi:hypothetical protein